MNYCGWRSLSPLDRDYHDNEWGIPIHNDRTQFEYLTLEVMQAGLSWELMLKKREIFRACFDNFNFNKIAHYTDTDRQRIMNTPGMIRSVRKIDAVISNAQNFLEIIAKYGSFDRYLWAFSDNKTIVYPSHADDHVPVSNHLSQKISKDLKKRGFKYIGPVVMYSHLQACGIINDHDHDCPRYQYILDHYPTVMKRPYGEKF